MGLFSAIGSLFGGGGGGGFSSGGFASGNDKSTTTNTTNETSYEDNRQVNDAGGGILGTGNSITTNNSTALTDARTAYTSSSTSQTDSSQRTNTNSGNVTWNHVDGGLVAGATRLGELQAGVASSIATGAGQLIDSTVTKTISALRDAVGFTIGENRAVLDSALSFASGSQARAYESSARAMGAARESFNDLARLSGEVVQGAQRNAERASADARAAFTAAADSQSGNRTLLIVAAGIAALWAVGRLTKG